MKLAYRDMSVLMVDSVSTALDTLQNFIKEFELYRVWTAKGAEEALKILGEKQVELIITASKLQPISGLQLVEMARKNPKREGLLVLVLVDGRDKVMSQRAMEVGADGVLSLPLKAKEVRETVDGLLSSLVDSDTEDYLQNLDMARKAFRKEDYEVAEAAYRGALKQQATEEAMMGLARTLAKKGHLQDAEQAYMDGLRAYKKSLRGYLGLAEVYQRLYETDKALKVLKAALALARTMKESGVTQASILFYMGEIEVRLRRIEEALGHFKDAADLMPEDANMQVSIGDSLVEGDYLAESEEFYERALEMDPQLAHVYNRLGMAYRKQGKYNLTLNLYEKALSFRPEDENLFYNIGRCYWEMKEHKQAAEKLTVALQLNPDFKEARQLLDVVLKELGYKVGSEEALDMLKKSQ